MIASKHAQKVRGKLAPLVRNPRWMVMRAFGRFDLATAAVSLRRPGGPSARPAVGTTVFPDVDSDEVCRALELDGVWFGLRLPSAVCDAILDFAQTTPCYADRDAERPLSYAQLEVDRGADDCFSIAQYTNTQRCPSITRLSTDPVLLAVARTYLRHEPVLQGTALWWSVPHDGDDEARSRAAQLFHFDLDGYRFVKFFFYLTPVDRDEGPHVVVRGTHRRKRLVHQLRVKRYSDNSIVSAYGEDALVEVYGPRGSGWAEDTRCFHKGITPTAGSRLALQLEFGRRDYKMASDEQL
jgi:hypothetical protein